ncbi:hypothetical protein EMPS_06897 [Entomortierella parvispora]|uniref:Uncharacterized protein n=1 Tax=Entomortierella parvispora TaxID=205924 RepID=A0A9P3HD78_9FUNG|nr:hypothetical protein EMPS_06897 [Entomortierella parvispora]
MVLGSLCKHDLTVCVRVNRAWYEQLIDRIWHTVEIQNLFSFHYFNDAYGPGSTDGPVSLARNVHRIRVLKVLYTRTLDAFLLAETTKEAGQEDKEVNDDGQAQIVPKENALLIEELFVHFGDDPPRPPPPDQVTDSFGRMVPRSRYSMPLSLYSTHSLPIQSSIHLDPLLDVLARSTQLVKFTTAVLPLRQKGQFEDEARLWTALPASLEQLRVIDNVGNSYMFAIDSRIPWMTGEERDALLDRVSRWPKPATSLENLRSLTVAGDGADLRILCEILMNRRPLSLEDLSLVDSVFRDDLENTCLLRLISQGSPKGWKTVGLSGCIYGTIGSQVVDALLQHAATLENVRVVALNPTLSSVAIQKLLCSAPNLKRFDTIPSRGRESNPAMLSAGDIIGSSQGWVCSKLESFKCMIEGIPRPDLQKRTNNRRLYGDLHDPDVYSKAQSQEIQRKVLAQLAQLTQLREITLGQDSIYSEDWDDEEYYDSDDDGDDITCAIQRGVQYECLTMTLEDGLDQLKNLKSMRRMNLHRMQHGQEVEELEWMKENWPVYGKEQRESFWADRGHWVHIGDLQYHSFDDVRHWESFDWW